MGGRGTGSGFREGGNTPAASAKATASASSSVTAKTASAARTATAQRAEALSEMRKYIDSDRVGTYASDFSGSPWTQTAPGVWQFSVDDAFPGSPIRTGIGARVRRRGSLSFDVTIWRDGAQAVTWRRIGSIGAADNLARREMRRYLDLYERQTE